MSSSIPSWQTLTAHSQPFRGARDLAFCLKVPLDSLLVWASSEGSGETAQMRRLAWTFAARICDKYQIRLTRSIWRRNLSCYPSVAFLRSVSIFCVGTAKALARLYKCVGLPEPSLFPYVKEPFSHGVGSNITECSAGTVHINTYNPRHDKT